jgi:nitroreductase
MLGKANAGIVVCGDLEKAHDSQLSYLLQDCSASVENMLLAANALGIGACWLGVHPREERCEHIRKLLGIPEKIIPISVISLGYPAEEKAPRTRYSEASVHSEKW